MAVCRDEPWTLIVDPQPLSDERPAGASFWGNTIGIAVTQISTG